MDTFKRNLEDDLIKSLKQTKLFEKLKADIECGEVFPAIRDNTIQFYYKGCRMFIYDKYGFSTHYKYLINNSKSGSKYVLNDGEGQITSDNFIVDNFCNGYDSIKQNLNIYAKPEATLTSGFYSKSFFDPSVKNLYYLFDIEAAFEKQEELEFDCEESNSKKRKGTDRVDAVFFDKSQGKIIFCEVKRFDDSRIYEKNGTVEVIDQLNRYKCQIAKRHDNIIKAYNNAMAVFSQLFGTAIFEVKDIYPQAWLFVTGCPKVLYEEKARAAVANIEHNGFHVHFSKKASGTALIEMCKKTNVK